jgi:hypothetical protein
LWPKISYKFHKIPSANNGSRVTSKRLEIDRDRLKRIRARKQKAGQKGGLAKARNMNEIRSSANEVLLAKASQIQNQTREGKGNIDGPSLENSREMLNESPITPLAISQKTRIAGGPPKYTPEFEAFWNGSTKRGSKFKASKLWEKLRGEADAITAGMQAWQKSEQWQNETKQPHITTWLGRRGWEEIIPRNGHGRPKETHAERITRENRETAALFNCGPPDATSNSAGPEGHAGAHRAVLPRPK